MSVPDECSKSDCGLPPTISVSIDVWCASHPTAVARGAGITYVCDKHGLVEDLEAVFLKEETREVIRNAFQTAGRKPPDRFAIRVEQLPVTEEPTIPEAK